MHTFSQFSKKTHTRNMISMSTRNNQNYRLIFLTPYLLNFQISNL